MEVIGEDFPEANCVPLKSGRSDPICILADVVVVFLTHLLVQFMLFILFYQVCNSQQP